MNCRSRHCAILAIALTMNNDFTTARRSLITTYLLIVGSVIVLFSSLVVYQTHDSFSDPVVKTDAEIVIGAHEARFIAETIRPGAVFEESEYEIERNELYFTVSFADDSEVKVNLMNGEAHVPEDESGFVETLTDDFEEIVGWIALVVFLLAALASIYVANKTLAPIARNMKKQKQFISDAAHELRNPLAALHARIESALLVGGRESKKEVLDDLLGETKRLISVSEALLALERGEQKKKRVEIQSVHSVLMRTIERLQPLLKEKNISVATEIEREVLHIDIYDLETILYNLLHNAIKFSNTGSAITVSWTNKKLSVSDTGIGISVEHISNIFDRFYKVDTARGGGGSGLGLALIKEIADVYGATMDVKSAVGKGSTFSIAFK